MLQLILFAGRKPIFFFVGHSHCFFMVVMLNIFTAFFHFLFSIFIYFLVSFCISACETKYLSDCYNCFCMLQIFAFSISPRSLRQCSTTDLLRFAPMPPSFSLIFVGESPWGWGTSIRPFSKSDKSVPLRIVLNDTTKVCIDHHAHRRRGFDT